MGAEDQQMGRRERKKREVAERIREAALELFGEKGYEATTVEEIAERADVAKGTFFNYFPRKDSLLEALSEHMTEDVLDESGPVERWKGTSRDCLLALFMKFGEMVEQNREFSKVMMIEKLRNFWMRSEADELEQEVKKVIRQGLARAAERGEIDIGADIMAGAKLLEVAYFTTMIEWLRSGEPRREYRREMAVKFDIIFRGLGAADSRTRG